MSMVSEVTSTTSPLAARPTATYDAPIRPRHQAYNQSSDSAAAIQTAHPSLHASRWLCTYPSRSAASVTIGVAGARTSAMTRVAAKFSAAHTRGAADRALAEAIADATHVRERGCAGAVELRAKSREMRLQPFGIRIAFLRPARTQQG